MALKKYVAHWIQRLSLEGHRMSEIHSSQAELVRHTGLGVASQVANVFFQEIIGRHREILRVFSILFQKKKSLREGVLTSSPLKRLLKSKQRRGDQIIPMQPYSRYLALHHTNSSTNSTTTTLQLDGRPST